MKSIIDTMKSKLNYDVKKIEYYEGGISNENYVIDDKYVYRRKKRFAQPFYSAKAELEIEEFLKDKNITVPLVSIFENGTKITLLEKDALDLSNHQIDDEILIKVAKKIRELHSLRFVSSENFEPFNRLNYYLESNHNQKRDINNYIVNKIKKYYENADLVLCHNDLVPGNILITEKGEIKIIDFEYASNNLPFFDVISFLSENNIEDQRQIDLFINTYFDNNPPENVKEMTEDFFNFLDLLWYNWSVMMYHNLHEPIYYHICKAKALRLKKIDINK